MKVYGLSLGSTAGNDLGRAEGEGHIIPAVKALALR